MQKVIKFTLIWILTFLSLPDPKNTMITECALRISAKNTFKKKSDIRYYVELVEVDEALSYEDIKNRDKIEYIGYEVAESDLIKNDCLYFSFDTFQKIFWMHCINREKHSNYSLDLPRQEGQKRE